MSQVAKLFIRDECEVVQLPPGCRLNTKEVFVHQDPETGDVILSRKEPMVNKPTTWDGFFAAIKRAHVPADFLDEKERCQAAQDRDPFEGWNE